MQAMHQVWRPSGPQGSRLNCAIFFSCRQCTQTRSAGPSVLLRFDGRSSCSTHRKRSAVDCMHRGAQVSVLDMLRGGVARSSFRNAQCPADRLWSITFAGSLAVCVGTLGKQC